MKKKHVRYIVAIIAAIFILTQTNYSNNSSVLPTSTISQPTLIPTEALGTTDMEASPSTIQKDRTQATLIKVVDGDTVQVNVKGIKETIRIIGINTPETVDPRKPVECFGKEASDKAKELFSKANAIELEQDLSQDDRDKYKRLLRYVFIDDVDYGKQMVAEGYAYEYTYEIPYRYQLDYKEAQRQATENKRGLWGDTACMQIDISNK